MDLTVYAYLVGMYNILVPKQLYYLFVLLFIVYLIVCAYFPHFYI